MAVPDLESLLYDYVEQFRVLLARETWQRFVLDLSKNDFLALLFLHRAGESRMSEVAAYLDAPLNTATGVVTRLERRGLVERHHRPDDKRVVVVALSASGTEQVAVALREGLRLAEQVLGELTPEELQVLLSVFQRVLGVLAQADAPAPARREVRRIAID